MVGKKVYAVERLVIEDCIESLNEIVLFADKQYAIAFAQNFIAGEKETLNKEIESRSWIEDDNFETNLFWECYENGYYTQNRSRVSISTTIVWEKSPTK